MKAASVSVNLSCVPLPAKSVGARRYMFILQTLPCFFPMFFIFLAVWFQLAEIFMQFELLSWLHSVFY